jgi:hypothetical protein
MSAPSAAADGRRQDGAGFATTRWVDWLGGHIARHRRLWVRLGNLESRLLADELAGTPVAAPIYVAGLARSGSTILLEMLERHPDTVSHRYKDYPPVFTPYWWNRLLQSMPQQAAAPAERAHQDGIVITPDSPEAFEEVLWMAFFPDLHDPERPAVLDGQTANPAFERFYRDHLRKLLKVRGGRRYLSKGNYNLTRLEYLLKLFPDARLVLPIREPVWHVASLAKQHRLFNQGAAGNPRALEHLRRVGHFEFGPDRRPINAGDQAAIATIQALWRDGREVEGWARYWCHLHGFLADRLEASPALRAAALVVHFEDLCHAPARVIGRLFEHCHLPLAEDEVEPLAARISFPSYYRPSFTAEETRLIERLTAPVLDRFAWARLDRASQSAAAAGQAPLAS